MKQAPESSAVKRDHVLESRIIAAAIDIVVLVGIGMIVTAVTGGIELSDKSSDTGGTVSLSGASFWLFIMVIGLYYFIQETRTGQTLGKRIMKVRVVALDGELTRANVLVRTLLRIVDFLPFLYLLGVILVLVTPQHQRLGDMAARTVVIRT
ncbi:MAG TPA: RDD family protein [Dehalococcoidia bacterium]|nr:RDD family protein [Dehalococcoidia bacterium]